MGGKIILGRADRKFILGGGKIILAGGKITFGGWLNYFGRSGEFLYNGI